MGIPTTCKTVINEEEFESIPRWEALLTNGNIVYSDGDYIEGRSDWERLKYYCQSNNVKIVDFCVAFRDHKIHLDKMDGYYFRRMNITDFGGASKDYFVVGGGRFPEITVYKYALPELMLFETESRLVEQEDLI